jgi:hypothetical protein
MVLITNKHVSSKMTATKFTHPWINTDIKKLIRSKKRHTKSKENKEEKG